MNTLLELDAWIQNNRPDFYDGWADDLKEELIDKAQNTTPAQFQRICIDAALNRLATERASKSDNVITMTRKVA